MSKQVNYNENLVAGAAIRDDKGRRISKLFEASHPKMTVGYAKNLIMPDDPTEQEFNFRQSGGGVIEDGVAVIDKVKGNSVVWNQIIAKPYTFGLDRNSTFASWFNGGSCSINDKGQFIFITNGGERGVGNALSLTPRNTHKYLLSYKVKADIASVCTVYQKSTSNIIANIAEADKWYFVSYIGDNTATSNYSSYLNTVVAANSPETTVTIDDAQVIDLTQMFGAGNEPATYEEFLSRKPKVADEFAYNEGEIINNKVEKVVTTGRNLWDEQWNFNYIDYYTGEPSNRTDLGRICSANFIKVDASKQFYFKCNTSLKAFYMHCYDVNKNWLGLNGQYFQNGHISTITIPNTAYIKFAASEKYGNGTTYNHDICINISDPSINGQYFPYEKHELDLSWVKDIKDAEGVKLFEDGMKSVGTAFDEAEKGRAIKRIGVKVFDGTEVWALESINSYGIANFRTKGLSKILSAPLLSAKYPSQTTPIAETQTIGLFNANESSLYIRELSKDFESVDAWKAHLAELHAAGNPLVVYYGLDTPIEVEYDEKNLTYPVVAGGTEEAIASEPSTAFRADIGYGIDAVKTILDLKARVEALEGK